MIIEALKRSILGIAFGGFITFLALTIMKFSNTEVSVSEMWVNMLCSMILGIYFGLISFVFEHKEWSPLKKTVIHFSAAIVVFLLIAIPVGWIPFHFTYIFWGILIFALIYGLYWVSFLLYFKKVEDSMNEQLVKKK